jgi:hypothetical protein
MATQTDTMETKDDAIVWVIGFQRENHKKQIIQFDDKLLSYWKVSMLSATAITGPVSGLGALQGMPNEILNAIVAELDIRSYLSFRNVSRITRNFTSSNLEFRRVVTHAPTCLMAMVRTRVAGSYTFADLYYAMLIRRCEECGGLAEYVYLPTLTKACDECLSTKRRFLTVTLASFAKGAGCTAATLRKRLNVVKTVPADYRGWGIVRTRPVDMICYAEGLHIVNDASKDIKPKFGDQNGGLFIRRMVTAPFPFFNKETREVEPILTCNGCGCQHRHIFLGIRTQQEYNKYLWKHLPGHTKEGLLLHLEGCAPAQRLWCLSHNGTFTPKVRIRIHSDGRQQERTPYGRLERYRCILTGHLTASWSPNLRCI